MGQPDDVLDLYSKSLSFWPDNFDALLGKCNAYLALNNLDSTIFYFERSLGVKPGGGGSESRLNIALIRQIGTDVKEVTSDIRECHQVYKIFPQMWTSSTFLQ